jgi:hypothetical protein
MSAVIGDCFNRTIVAGPSVNGGSYFLTARFLADGSADASFAPPNDLGQTNLSAAPLQLLVRPNGRIIALALANNELDVVQYQGDLPCGVVSSVEYYYAAWNYYFETAFPNEIEALDAGAFGGVWQRTGETFNVWPQPNASARKTCRHFSTAFAPKSSHFFSPYPTECAVLETSNRPLHPASGPERALLGRHCSALSPLQQRHGRRAQPPLHDELGDLQSDDRSGMGLRGRRAHPSVCVRSTVGDAFRAALASLSRWRCGHVRF